MSVPHIIAVDDVHLVAHPAVAAQVEAFYTERLGLDRVPGTDADLFAFRGYRRSGPRLLVKLTDRPEDERSRRQARIQIASLEAFLASLEEEDGQYEWIQGLSFYERRLRVDDPAGNRIELVEIHLF